MLGILGTDRTAELDDRESSVFADLCSKAQMMENKVVRLEHDINGGYFFAGNIEIISEDKARSLIGEFDRLKGMCNQIQRYNTKAKMRNIEWPVDVVRTTMTETRRKVEELSVMLRELEDFKQIVSYLRTAQSNIPEGDFKKEITDTIEQIATVVTQSKGVRDAYKNSLDALRNRYAEWYMNEYLKAHISTIDASKLQRVANCDSKRVCDIVNEASFINPMQYELWKQKLSKLKPANPAVTKQAIVNMPTSVDGFNPTLQDGILPSISEMEDELNEIFNGYESQFHDALEDPTTQRNKEMLSDVEKTTIQQFVDGDIKLDVQYARPLMEIIKKLQHSFARVEISNSDIAQIFSRPMNKQQALDAFAQFIDDKSRGHRPEDVRIIVRLNN